jgi:UDP-N-acetylmuramoyl-L-alanyl-D-glutamate--2,6-diaminopimelate ligase
VARALERGATGVLLQDDCPEAGAIRILVPDGRRAFGRLCHVLAGEPSRRLDVLAVAGARGRTPAAVFLRSILEADGQRFGYVGSLGWSDGSVSYPRTDDGPTTDILVQMLAGMVERRCSGAVVELPLAALAGGVDEALDPLRAVLVSALPPAGWPDPDPLAVRRHHARLLRKLVPDHPLILDGDDPDVRLLGAVRLDVTPVVSGLGGGMDVRVLAEPDGPGCQRLQLLGPDRWPSIRLRIPGRIAAAAAAAAAILARLRGIKDGVIAEGLEALDHIPDHLEAIHAGQRFGVWLDTARTPEDLAESLRSVRQGVAGSIHLVLPVADPPGVDPAMAAVVEELADRIVLTSDGDGGTIDRDAWALAFREPGRLRVEPDRARAIESTLSAATDGDSVLIISGRGQGIERIGRRVRIRDDRAAAIDWIADSRRSPVSLARRA